jgi:hypothetical protein
MKACRWFTQPGKQVLAPVPVPAPAPPLRFIGWQGPVQAKPACRFFGPLA